MLQRKGKPVTLTTYGFLVGVEIEDGGSASPEQVALRIADSLTYIEDVGHVDVESLGKVDLYDEGENE